MNEASIVFAEELAAIDSSFVKEFVIECFDKLTPSYFWTGPASSSGKHHPKMSNKKHGLVLHVKLCVWWGRKIAQSYERCNMDIIIAALLLHDLQKFGTAVDKDGKPNLAEYSSAHGPMLAMQIENMLANQNKTYEYGTISIIIAAIAMHMGKWTNQTLSHKWKDMLRKNNNVEIVHLADYMASRKIGDKLEELDSLSSVEIMGEAWYGSHPLS